MSQKMSRQMPTQLCSHGYSNNSEYLQIYLVYLISRALVRAGGTGGKPPVNFSQRVAATRQFKTLDLCIHQFLFFKKLSTN